MEVHQTLPSLRELDARHHYLTDKLGHCPHNRHDYTDATEFHFGPLRDRPLVFWEIGVDRGDSMRMWADYLPLATVVGLDVRPPTLPGWTLPKRCVFSQTDVRDRDRVERLAAEYPPDVVLDDGSHRASDLTAAFDTLWPHTRLIYAAEDLGTQYPDRHGGEFLDAAPFTDRVKSLCDGLARMDAPSPRRVCWEPGQVYLYK